MEALDSAQPLLRAGAMQSRHCRTRYGGRTVSDTAMMAMEIKWEAGGNGGVRLRKKYMALQVRKLTGRAHFGVFSCAAEGMIQRVQGYAVICDDNCLLILLS